jgi:hypothetical protein
LDDKFAKQKQNLKKKTLRFEYFENQLPMIFICLGARDLSIRI